MLLDPGRFAFTRHLESEFATFLREMTGLRREDFEPWPDKAAFGGDWLTFPLFLASHPPDVERVFARNQAKCPRSTAALRAAPGVVSAGFSWMEPGCHIYRSCGYIARQGPHQSPQKSSRTTWPRPSSS